MHKSYLLILVLFSLYSPLKAQTVGVVQIDESSFDDGYVLFAPTSAKTTYLIDQYGRQINTWESMYSAGQSVYLLNDGSILRTCNLNNTNFVAGGQGGRIEKIDWEGNVSWSYTISDDTKCQHHDVKEMPNGNILIIAWELKTAAEAIAEGRNPSLIGDSIWSEQIIEIEPTGSSGGNIIWEWHLWDHVIQDFDENKANYGDISSNPQLLDINFRASATNPDWIHLNSVDYNASLDQIVLSSHNTNEIWIVDHSTSTEQAASHSGGNSEKGGDILCRWGNPMAYDAGTKSDQKFYGQHNAYWIESGFPFEDQIMVFNNGIGSSDPYSTVEIINPPVEGYTYSSDLPYLPDTYSWIYNEGNVNDLYSNSISGAQQLESGHVLICDGLQGTFLEVDNSGTTVWKYVSPVQAKNIINQGTEASRNNVFRCTYYSKDFSGFDGKTLTPGSIIEDFNTVIETNAAVDTNTADVNSINFDLSTSLYPNPATEYLINKELLGNTIIYNTLGITLWSGYLKQEDSIDISGFPNGIYYLKNKNSVIRFIVKK